MITRRTRGISGESRWCFFDRPWAMLAAHGSRCSDTIWAQWTKRRRLVIGTTTKNLMRSKMSANAQNWLMRHAHYILLCNIYTLACEWGDVGRSIQWAYIEHTFSIHWAYIESRRRDWGFSSRSASRLARHRTTNTFAFRAQRYNNYLIYTNNFIFFWYKIVVFTKTEVFSQKK